MFFFRISYLLKGTEIASSILAILFRSEWKAMQRQMNLNGSVVEVTKIDKGQENLDQIGAGMQD